MPPKIAAPPSLLFFLTVKTLKPSASLSHFSPLLPPLVCRCSARIARGWIWRPSTIPEREDVKGPSRVPTYERMVISEERKFTFGDVKGPSRVPTYERMVISEERKCTFGDVKGPFRRKFRVLAHECMVRTEERSCILYECEALGLRITPTHSLTDDAGTTLSNPWPLSAELYVVVGQGPSQPDSQDDANMS
jgi:hypothetical protein